MNERCDVILYTSYLHVIGGIETFILNFIDLMSDTYSIGIYCPRLPEDMKKLIKGHGAKLYQNEKVDCETLIMVRMMDFIPRAITFGKSVRMCHACKSDPSWVIKQDCDKLIHVSNASKTSFQTSGDIIYNPLLKSSKQALLLVSATRIPGTDKGKNAQRMLQLARMLNNVGIMFLWLNFSDAPLTNAPRGFVNVGCYHDLQPYISKADYLVQLSDNEGFGYSVLEALINKTAVIVTPFATTKELQVEDGVNGYVIPFDMNFDVNKLLNVPKFTYSYDNEHIRSQWHAILSEPAKPRPQLPMVRVRVTQPYFDIQLSENLRRGEVLEMHTDRAEYLQSRELVIIT